MGFGSKVGKLSLIDLPSFTGDFDAIIPRCEEVVSDQERWVKIADGFGSKSQKTLSRGFTCLLR